MSTPIGTLTIEMVANVARLQKDMDAAKKTVGDAMASIKGGANSAMNALAGLGLSLSAAAFASYIKGAIDAADKLNDLSKATSISVENLSGLELAAKQSGGDLEGTAQAINKLSVQMGQDAERFKKLGITAKDPLEAFKQLSDIFVQIKDPQLRAAVAAEALGKSWASAAPLLAEGSAKIQEMIDKGKELSGITPELVARADEFNDKLAEIGAAAKGTSITIAGGLLPILVRLAEEFTESKRTGGALSVLVEAIAVAFEAVIVIVANVVYVLKQIGLEIVAIAKQLGALATLDFTAFSQIGDDAKASAAAARKDIDAFSESILTARKRAEELDAVKRANKVDDLESSADAAAAAAAAKAAKEFLDNQKNGVDSYQKMIDGADKLVASIKFEAEALIMSNTEKETAVNLQKLMTLGLKEGTEEYKKYTDAVIFATLQKEQMQKIADVQKQDKADVEKATKSLDDFLDPAKAQTFGEALNGAFGLANSSLSKLLGTLQTYGIKQAEIEKARKDASLAYAGDADKLASVSAQLTEKETINRVSAYGEMAGAAKGFFNESSDAYRLLAGVEKAMHLVQMAYMAEKLVTRMFLTTTEVTGNAAVAASGVASDAIQLPGAIALAEVRAVGAVANQGNGDPYTAFPRIAAMIALMAGIGLVVGAGGGGSSTKITKDAFAEKAANNGSGTVLGDPNAQSQSITRSLETLVELAKPGLNYTAQMVKLLEGIKNSLTGVTNNILANGFDAFGKGFKETSSSGGNWLTGSSSSSTSLADVGLAFAEQTVGDALKSMRLQQYEISKTEWSKSGFLGFGKKSGVDYETSFKDVNESVSKALTGTVQQMFTLIGKASGQIGGSASQLEAAKLLETGLGKVSLKDKTGDQIQKELTAVFGAMGDTMAKAVAPGIADLQKAGEGYLETLIRVSNGLSMVNVWAKRLGGTLLDTSIDGARAADNLIEAFGGIDKMVDATTKYYETYYSETERAINSTLELSQAMADIGVEMPQTKEAFRALVDAARAAGDNALYASLIKLAPAFDQLKNSLASAIDSALQDLQTAVQREQKEIERKKAIAQAQADVAKENLDSLTSIFDFLTAQIDELSGAVNSAQSAAEGMAFIRNAVEAANNTGYLPDQKMLETAVSAVRAGMESTNYATAYQQKLAQMQLAAQLSDLKGVAEEQKTTAELQLEVAQKAVDDFNAQSAALNAFYEQQLIYAQTQINELRSVNGSVLTVAGAMSALGAAIDAAKMQNSGGGSGGGGGGGADNSRTGQINSLYQEILGRNAEAGGLNAWNGSGLSIDQIREGIQNSPEARGFATGGYYPGGLAMVGEQGAELINFNRPGQVYTAGQTAEILGGGSLAAEIQGLRTDIQAQSRSNAQIQIRTAKVLERWETNGLPEVRLEV